MQVLDTKAVQYSALHESDLVNQATRHKIGSKFEPFVLENALRIYADATKHIAAAPHNAGLVQSAGEEALFAAHRAWFITERILALQRLSVEDIALEEEKQLSDISTALGQKDLRDQALFKQAQIIAGVAKAAIQNQTRLSTDQSTTQNMEKRLTASDALLQQCNILVTSLNSQILEKDAQLKALGDKPATTETRAAP
jgi:hypothetical protein